jgi:hypothetical protein
MSTEQASIAPVVDANLDPEQDLINALAAAGHPNPTFWLHTLEQCSPGARDKTTSGTWRRMMVNRALHVIIGEIDEETAPGIRYLLVDQGSHDDWLCLIRENVAPWLALIAQRQQ